MKIRIKPLSIAIFAIAASTGCAQLDNAYKTSAAFAKQNKGAITGTLTGAAAGVIACNGEPACIAAAAIAGGALGHLWDLREKQLRKLASQQNIELSTKRVNTYNKKGQDNGVEIAIKNDGMFQSGSSKLNPSAKDNFKHIASIYKNSPQKILIMGHTDASGSDDGNQRLSELRAKSVAKLFEQQGVSSQLIYFQGAGETQPVASNSTRLGRSQNRRVEILEIDSEDSMLAYTNSKETNPALLAHTTKTQKEIKIVKQTIEKQPLDKKAVGLFDPIIDFGGKPASPNSYNLFAAAGEKEKQLVSFSLFNKAEAAAIDAFSPCYLDNFRSTGKIKNLNSGKTINTKDQYSTSDYYNGLYQTSWVKNVNGHLVAVKDLAVLRHSGMSIGDTKFVIHKDWYNGTRNNQPDHSVPVKVNTYKGENGVLIRMYFEGDISQSPLSCSDIVIPKKSGKPAVSGAIYYGDIDNIHSVTYTPSKIKL